MGIRKSSNPDQKTLEVMKDQIFEPSKPQMKLKAKFWTIFNENPIADYDNITLDTVRQLTDNEGVNKWWKVPGFREWFLNKDEHRFSAAYVWALCMQRMEKILANDDPKAANAQVNLIKFVAELTGNSRKNSQDSMIDKFIAEMDEAQIQAYLEKQGQKYLLQAKKG